MRKWLLTYFVFSYFLSYSQTTYDTAGYHLLLKADLSTYVPAFFPYLDLELEFPLSRKIGITLCGGPIVGLATPSFINGLTALDRKGFVLNPNVKYYFTRSHTYNNQQYISIDYLYRDAFFRSVEELDYPDEILQLRPSAQSTYQDTIAFRHKAMGGTINFGQMLYFKNWGADFSIGIGANFMRNRYSEELYANAKFHDLILQPFWQKETFWIIRAPLRYRIFYRF
jgi:hypothetical protein